MKTESNLQYETNETHHESNTSNRELIQFVAGN